MSDHSHYVLAFPEMATNKARQRLKPRKQPLQARAAETVAAIVEAAARILERHGIQGYTTNAVAERAGVSIGSLYQYFPNKDALTAALIERETAVLLADLQRARPCATYVEMIGRLIDAAVAHQMRRPALARLLDFEEARLPLGERNERVAAQILGFVRSTLALEDAPFVADPEIAAADVLAITRGMIDAAGDRGEIDPRALSQRVQQALFGYLGAPAPARRKARVRR